MDKTRTKLIGAFLLFCAIATPARADAEGLRIGDWPTNYPVSGTVTAQLPTGTNVTIQNYNITGSTAASQTIATYTVPAGVTFYLEYAEAEAYYLSFTTGVSNFGAAYFSFNGQHGYTTQLAGAGVSRSGVVPFNPPLAYPAGTVISWVVSPAATTPTVWYGNFGGYYK
jgi:hypothetical protein